MTKNDDKRVPALRFKGFNDDWAQRKLKNLVSFSKGKGYTKNDLLSNGTPILLYGMLYTNYLERYSNFFTYAKANLKSVYSTKHEVVMPDSGETSVDIARASWVDKPGVILGGGLIILKPKDIIFPGFLAYSLTYGKNHKDIASKAQGKSVVHIHSQDLVNLKFFFPKNIVTQRKICNLLEEVNTYISLQQRKAQQLKLLKKAMMQDLFNDRDIPKLRFSGFKDNWSNVNLGEIGKATGGTPLESEFIKNGSYKVISIGSYTENHKYNNQGMRVNLNRKTKKRIMNKDDLAMILNDKTKSGKIIGSVLLISDNDSFVYNQRTERIEPNHDKFSSQFLFQYLNANTIRNKIVSNAQGNTQIYVNWSTISKINYLIPSIDEQKRIGKLLFSLDSIIDIQQGKIEKYYKVKHFLLQNMFI